MKKMEERGLYLVENTLGKKRKRAPRKYNLETGRTNNESTKKRKSTFSGLDGKITIVGQTAKILNTDMHLLSRKIDLGICFSVCSDLDGKITIVGQTAKILNTEMHLLSHKI